jgi:hypothetical protein
MGHWHNPACPLGGIVSLENIISPERPAMTNEQIKHMTERFLSWKLPADFNPDAGITFDPIYNRGTAFEMRHKPTGTNLFTYTQAEVMVRAMIEGIPND